MNYRRDSRRNRKIESARESSNKSTTCCYTNVQYVFYGGKPTPRNSKDSGLFPKKY